MKENCFKGLTFQELISDNSHEILDGLFYQHLEKSGAVLDQWVEYQSSDHYCSDKVLLLAPYVETFIAELFQIQEPVSELRAEILKHHPISWLKKEIVLKKSRRQLKSIHDLQPYEELAHWLTSELKKDFKNAELPVAIMAKQWFDDEQQEKLDKLSQLLTHELNSPTLDWISLNIPKRLDHENWVESNRDGDYLKSVHYRLRQGFALTDDRADLDEISDEVNYCVYCHAKQGDFCRTGFPNKKGDSDKGLKKDPFNRILTGCPLDEKISEMNVLRKEGFSIAALATIMIDNPMCAATGHRICNDCMKSCIYQKQNPVNIPQIETRILTDVLALPYGVEIYLLLMRWLPIRLNQPRPKIKNNQKICVMGMGPAGFTLAYHLLMEGCTVVGMDGLKIEPLPQKWIDGPVESAKNLWKSLDKRDIVGFGGVAEYGITSRWDKNFLSLIYLGLLRWKSFRVFGGVRFGGTMNLESIQALGFNHLSLAVGAGLPKALDIPGSMAPGMMQANDFLMNLQLTGAVRKDSMVPLEVNLPAIIIGGGLTGVDTATEVQAYYIEMVKRVYRRFKAMNVPLADFLQRFEPSSHYWVSRWVEHGKALYDCPQNPKAIQDLIHSWGGVTIVYRKRMQDSPAYRLNAEELEEALKEGILYLENHSPKSVSLGKDQRISSIKLENTVNQKCKDHPVYSVLVATGAKPNVAYSFEYYGTFEKENGYYKPFVLENNELKPMVNKEHCKEPEIGVMTNYHHKGFRVSYVGDAHPVYHGSVVKAIASAKNHYLDVIKALPNYSKEDELFLSNLDQLFANKVIENRKFSKSLRLLRCQVPLAKNTFKPGQFYRIQSLDVDLKNEAFEALSAWVVDMNPNASTIDFIVPQSSLAERKVMDWKKDQQLAIMGPTGVRFKIPSEPTSVLLITDDQSAYKLLHVAKTMKDSNHQMTVVCHGKMEPELKEALSSFVDTIECFDGLEDLINIFPKTEDAHLIQYVYICATGETVKSVGSYHKALRSYFAPDCEIKASVHGPMQCMLKGICAQCLQWQINPETGLRTKAVFACSWQDQPVELVDWNHYGERLTQGKTLELFNQVYRDWALAQ